jgi:hypothetical protein
MSSGDRHSRGKDGALVEAQGRRRSPFQYSMRSVLVALAVVAALFGVWSAWLRPRPSVVEHQYIGWSEERVLDELGQPNRTIEGYQRVGTEGRRVGRGPFRTLQYDEIDGGYLTVWLTRESGEWRCFESVWFREGVQF